MRNFRRFELKKGNKELFWEISRHDKELYTRSGKLKRKEGEKAPHPKREEMRDHRLAMLEYDKLIQRKLSQGYEEVDKASKPSEDIHVQAFRLVTLDKKETLSLTEGEAYSLLNFMIDQEVINKRSETKDISKWETRVLRKTEYSSLADIDPYSEDFISYFDEWKAKSTRSRQYTEEMIPAFKYTDPSYWIITEKECRTIVTAIRDRIQRKRENLEAKKLDSPEKDVSASKAFILREQWLNFHLKAIDAGGYEVIPGNIQFHTNKYGHHLFFDIRDWAETFSHLEKIDIWDELTPRYLEEDYESLYDFIIEKTLEELGHEEELFAVDDGIKHEITSQLIDLSDDINEVYRAILAEKKPNQNHEDASLIEHGFKWNVTNLKKLKKVLETVDETIFEEELVDFHDEQIAGLIDTDDLDQDNIEQINDRETIFLINETLNDACHLLNHSYQNILNTTDILISIDEDTMTNVFEDKLEDVIRCLEDLYPGIADVEFDEDSDFADIYEFRPAGLDDELMSDWLHLLPAASVCLDLLHTRLEFDRRFEAMLEDYPSALSLILFYVKQELAFLHFQSQTNRERKEALQEESDEPNKILMYKFTDLIEPWIITPHEVSLLIAGMDKHFKELPAVLVPFRQFLETAEESNGFSILVAEAQ